MRCFLWVPVVVMLASCKDDGAAASGPPPAPTPRTLAGVYPEKWQCDSVATLDALAQVLGGTAKQIDSPMSVPRGVPRPCNYELQAQALEYWTFDIDCRDGMKQRADALFAQYKTTSQELLQQYNEGTDAGAIKPADAGPPSHAPEAAAEVAIGAKGLDHHGQGLIFIDDDAPCYVRVVGKDAVRRLELARLVAKHLTFANAPMTPRASP